MSDTAEEEVPAGTSPRTRVVFYIMKESVSAETLSNLHIRVVAEESLSYSHDADLGADSVPCWAILKAGITKLVQYGYTIVHTIDTQYEGVKFVALANPDGFPAMAHIDPNSIKTVSVQDRSHFAGNMAAKFTEIIKRDLIPAVNKNVIVKVPHGNTSPCCGDDTTFVIHIYASPMRGEIALSPPLWGHDINPSLGRSGNFSEWTVGDPVMSPEGVEVGAFNRNDLFIYLDVCHFETDMYVDIFRHIVTYVGTRISQNQVGQVDTELAQQMYVKYCTKRSDTMQREMSSRQKELEDQTARLQGKIVETIREHHDLSIKLNGFDTYKKNLAVKLEEEFQQMRKLPRVTAVNWRGTSLLVHTDLIEIVDPRTNVLHEIGEFMISINSVDSMVRFYNKTRLVHGFREGMHAPHVFPDGRACLGSMDGVIPRLISSYEWSAAVQMSIAFLESVNVEDGAGRRISAWPRSARSLAAESESARDIAEVASARVVDAGPAGEDYDEEMDDVEEIEEETEATF